MAVFSRRNGYNAENMQLGCASETLKKRIWARFFKQEFDAYDTMDRTHYTTGIEDMMIEMGVSYDFPHNHIIKTKNAKALEEELLYSEHWYTIYDFIEREIRNE